MKELKFRALRADEVECRVAFVNEKGVQLLLYKDARCDMNMLDEKVGPYNWKREHTRDNANCIVSIYDEDKKQWIPKEDTGTESNTEKEKGLASDSFKRACFNWGIGRELYTAPSIWIYPNQCKNFKNERDKYICKDKFVVTDMQVENGKITELTIKNTNTGKIVFPCENTKPVEENTPQQSVKQETPQQSQQETVTEAMLTTVKNEMERTGRSLRTILNFLGIEKLEDMSVEDYTKFMNASEKTPSKQVEVDNGSTR